VCTCSYSSAGIPGKFELLVSCCEWACFLRPPNRAGNQSAVIIHLSITSYPPFYKKHRGSLVFPEDHDSTALPPHPDLPNLRLPGSESHFAIPRTETTNRVQRARTTGGPSARSWPFFSCLSSQCPSSDGRSRHSTQDSWADWLLRGIVDFDDSESA
jgi:hypothetical protein